MGAKVISKRNKTFLTRKTLTKVLTSLIAALFVVAPSVLHSQVGIGFSPILTGSMRPYANPGDVFVTKLTRASALKVGDIISVHSQSSGVFYAHRIVQITTQSGLLRVVTKGDANSTAEVDPFMVSPIEGVSKNVARVKWLGRPLVYLTSIQGKQAGLGLMVIASVIALFLFLFGGKNRTTNPFQTKVYKELYSEAQEVKEIQAREIQMFKKLFTENSGNREIREFEMAELMNKMKQHQLTKEI